jgi:hypothetical protein
MKRFRGSANDWEKMTIRGTNTFMGGDSAMLRSLGVILIPYREISTAWESHGRNWLE